MKNNIQIKNCLNIHLSNFLLEFPENKELIFDCFFEILYNANIESRIIVKVLEEFKDEYADDIILKIKITEGW